MPGKQHIWANSQLARFKKETAYLQGFTVDLHRNLLLNLNNYKKIYLFKQLSCKGRCSWTNKTNKPKAIFKLNGACKNRRPNMNLSCLKKKHS